MKIKPLYLLNIILTVVLLISLLANAAIDSSRTAATKEYDPWKDMNIDGKINLSDLVILAGYFGTSGTSINTTALLLELQARVNSLNASLLDSKAYFNTKMMTLNASLVEIQSKVNGLETKIAEMNATIISLEDRIDLLNATKLKAEPDWDSGWVTLPAGKVTPFTHDLNTTNVLVYMIGKDVDGTYDIHQWKFGADDNALAWLGTGWLNLTETTIKVARQKDDAYWDEVRIMIWKLPES